MNKPSLKIVRRSDRLFWSGRRLVRDVYSSAWGTEPCHLCDDYDFAVLICDGDEVRGNLNIKVRTPDNLLPSEKYFRERHWEAQYAACDGNVAELCSLAVSGSLPNRERILVFNGLILGSHLLAMQQDIRLYATVQRSALINTLIRIMRYPFRPSGDQTLDAAGIPDDKYWTTKPLPRLYYVSAEWATGAASFKLLHAFLDSGLTIEGITPPILAAEQPPPVDAESSAIAA